MGHHCQDSSCSHGSCSSGHSHGASAGSKCSCGCNCSCSQCQCSCHQQGKYADDLLHLADQAWMEVLKEKIKEEINLNAGEHLTKLAKLISSSNHARWRDKMQGKKDYEDFETQLKGIMCCNQQKK
jgi:hypothetical protein